MLQRMHNYFWNLRTPRNSADIDIEIKRAIKSKNENIRKVHSTKPAK